MENISWNVFAASGRVEDYLRYKGESEHFVSEDRMETQQSSCTDRTGEGAVWEKPLR